MSDPQDDPSMLGAISDPGMPGTPDAAGFTDLTSVPDASFGAPVPPGFDVGQIDPMAPPTFDTPDAPPPGFDGGQTDTAFPPGFDNPQLDPVVPPGFDNPQLDPAAPPGFDPPQTELPGLVPFDTPPPGFEVGHTVPAAPPGFDGGEAVPVPVVGVGEQVGYFDPVMTHTIAEVTVVGHPAQVSDGPLYDGQKYFDQLVANPFPPTDSPDFAVLQLIAESVFSTAAASDGAVRIVGNVAHADAVTVVAGILEISEAQASLLAEFALQVMRVSSPNSVAGGDPDGPVLDEVLVPHPYMAGRWVSEGRYGSADRIDAAKAAGEQATRDQFLRGMAGALAGVVKGQNQFDMAGRFGQPSAENSGGSGQRPKRH